MYDIIAATGSNSKIQIPKIKINKVIWIQVRFVFHLDLTSISNTSQGTFLRTKSVSGDCYPNLVQAFRDKRQQNQ